MTDPVISPDGKWMWTGSEWIPATPGVETALFSVQDSVIAGDVNITQNNAEDITAAFINALEQTDARDQSSSKELTQSHESEYARLLIGSRQPEDNESDVDPKKESHLGWLAVSEGRYLSAEQHYLLALKLFKENGDEVGVCDVLFSLGLLVAYQLDDLERAILYGQDRLTISREVNDKSLEASSLQSLGDFSLTYGDLDAAEKYYRECLAIEKELDNPTCLLIILNSLGEVSEMRGNLFGAEGWYRVGLTLMEKLGDRGQEADSLTNLARVLGEKGQKVEERRMISKAVRIWREIGDPVPQYYLDEGY